MNAHSIIVSTALVALLACSGNSATVVGSDDGGGATSEGGADGGSGVTNAMAASDAANAYCARAASCAPAYVTIAYGTTDECVQRLGASLLQGITANGSNETPSIVEECTTAITNASCSDLLGRNLPAVCTPPAGSLADGTACAEDSQCSGGRCHIAAGTVCGTCGEPSNAGTACSQDDDCANGMKCSAANSTCQPYGAMGAACDADRVCNPTYACVNGTCGAPGVANTPCTTSDECDELHGIFCDGTKCTSVGFAPAAGACGLVSGVLTLCEGPAGDCQGVAAPTYRGTCVAAAADGAACDATNGPMCTAPAVCVNSVCELPDPTMCH